MDINFEKTIMNRRSRTLTQMAQSTRRLNSGYRINSAADDAAGLAVSEKMRSIDIGLRQGLRNISDGMNFLATQDGAEQVINDSLHRLKEIAVEAANGTYSRVEREALDLEYQQILDEIGDITSVGDFNGVPLFDQHLPEYSKFAGEIEHTDFIDVVSGKNSPLVVNYTENGVNKTVSLNIPSGRWTADEIADMIDDTLYEMDSPLIIGVNSRGQFSLQCEGGKVNYITGPGRSLFYEQKDGVKSGFLIGVTRFGDETSEVKLLKDHNDVLQFRLEGDPSDRVYTVHLLKDGETGDYKDGAKGFNYSQLIERLNEGLAEALTGTEYAGTVTAIRAKNSDGDNVIGLSSDLPVTGLAGNFIWLEDPDNEEYSSALYDISSYSSVDNSSSTIDGKKDLGNNVNIFRDRNDYFVMEFKYYTGEKEQGTREVRFDLLDPVDSNVHEKNYTPQALVDKINSIIADNFKDLDFVPAKAELKHGKIFFESTQYGNLCNVDIIETSAPSGYMLTDLFDVGTFAKTPAVTQDSVYTPASCTGQRNINSGVTIDDAHNKLQYNITVIDPKDNSSHSYKLDFTLDTGSYSAQSLVSKLNEQLANKINDIKNGLGGADRTDLKVDMKFEISGGGLSLRANGESGTAVSYIYVNNNQSVSTGYRRLIQGVSYTGGPSSIPGKSVIYKQQSSTKSVDYSNGTDAGKPYYTSVNNPSTKSETKTLYTFAYDAPEMTRGGPDTFADKITNENGTPAILKYNSAGTQFDKDGKAIRDIDVKFTLFDGVNTFEYNQKFAAGATKQDIVDAINAASADIGNPNGKVTASFPGDQLVITSEAKGNNMRFTRFDGGNIAEKATNHAPAGATIDYENNTYTTAPQLTLSAAGSNLPLTLNGSNNTISFNVGGTSVDVTLGNTGDTINMSMLVLKINAAFNEKFGNGKVTASSSGNQLTIKGGEGITGDITYTSSSAIPLDKRLNPATSVAQPGRATLPDADTQLNLQIVDGSCDTLTFSYTTPEDGTQSVSIDLSDGFNGKVYSDIGALAADLNAALPPEHQGKVRFSKDPYTQGLVISTTGTGAGYRISGVGGNMNLDKKVTKADVPAGVTPDYENNIVHLPASVSNGSFYNLFSTPGMEIVKDVNDTVSVTVDGENVTIKLDPGIYTSSSSIMSQLRNKTDSSSGKKLTDIVDISNTNGLTFTSNKGGSGIGVDISGTTANIFQTPRADFGPDYQRRISVLCRINGTADNRPEVEIHDWDNEMTFKYKSTDTEHEIKVKIPAGKYANNELVEALQTAIDGKLGKDQLKVEANSNGTISIVGATITANRSIRDFKGRLYDRIIQSDVFTLIDEHEETAGLSNGQIISYILGRNPMEPVTDEEIEANTNIIIYPNLNDNFTFDLKYDVKSVDENGDEFTQKRTVEISLTLPAGEYDRKKFAETVQELTREQLPRVASGLDPEKFRATIGLAPIGVADPTKLNMPSKDRLVLSYATPQDGSVDYSDVTFEGIRGTIAYRAFYQASDTPRPTTIVGAANIKNGVTIEHGVNNRFTVGFEGEFITVDLPSGYYTSDQLLNTLNAAYEAMGAGIRASMKGDNLMLYSAENGAFTIDPITGNGAYTLFYGGEKRDDDDSYIGIHSGRRTGSYIWYEKTRLDQHLMRINTTGVTTIERALKAITRLDGANAYLLKWRGLNGANENRSARTYDRNNVLIENLQNSESSIRDTDMAAEFSNVQKQQIIQQFQDNLLVQTKNIASDMVLNQLNQKG